MVGGVREAWWCFLPSPGRGGGDRGHEEGGPGQAERDDNGFSMPVTSLPEEKRSGGGPFAQAPGDVVFESFEITGTRSQADCARL